MPSSHSDEELILSWLDANSVEGDPESSWATLELDYELAYHLPERAWPIILELIQRAPDDGIVAIIAAGPLENLLCEHGPSFIERVEARASFDSGFRHCLAGVWGSNRMPREIFARMRTAVGDERL